VIAAERRALTGFAVRASMLGEAVVGDARAGFEKVCLA
jgi:hypothetical protein